MKVLDWWWCHSLKMEEDCIAESPSEQQHCLTVYKFLVFKVAVVV